MTSAIWKPKKTAIVVGSGAGGAMIAKELQGAYNVTVLEAGRAFHPFAFPVEQLAKFRKTGLFFDERLIQLLFPNMKIMKTKDMVLVKGSGLGGTTTLATGNAVRYDAGLQAMGICLDEEFQELYEELPITTEHQRYWNHTTRSLFQIFETMGLDPVITPKLLHVDKCISCGQCAIGCSTGAKWDTRALLEEAMRHGARCITGCKVTNVEIIDGAVTAVHAITNGRRERYMADVVILAAGGLGTPQILEQSGIPCNRTLFVDPVLCVAAPYIGAKQNKQIQMPFISQQDHYILSPYMDYLSFFFHKEWRLPMSDMVSVMIKLADESLGGYTGRQIDKPLTAKDYTVLQAGVEQCKAILRQMGIDDRDMFLGTINAGHPGGMLPLTADEKDTLHSERLPERLYIADATILPEAMGNPPILTIMALAKRIARHIIE